MMCPQLYFTGQVWHPQVNVAKGVRECCQSLSIALLKCYLTDILARRAKFLINRIFSGFPPKKTDFLNSGYVEIMIFS